MNNKDTLITIACVAALSFALGVTVTRNADYDTEIKVLPCSAWAGDDSPFIPPFTFTGACELPNGYLSVPTPPEQLPTL